MILLPKQTVIDITSTSIYGFVLSKYSIYSYAKTSTDLNKHYFSFTNLQSWC